eukprot:2366564-Pleurochrysis_carterae.AAC.1
MVECACLPVNARTRVRALACKCVGAWVRECVGAFVRGRVSVRARERARGRVTVNVSLCTRARAFEGAPLSAVSSRPAATESNCAFSISSATSCRHQKRAHNALAR